MNRLINIIILLFLFFSTQGQKMPGHERDSLRLTLNSNKQNDNGIQYDIKDAKIASLGMKLLKGLSRDVNTKIIFQNKHGTKVIISIKNDPLNEHNHELSLSRETEVSL